MIKSADISYGITGWSAGSSAIPLLQAMQRTGSIKRAAKSIGRHHKTARQELRRIANMLPYPSIEKRTE